MWGAKASEVAEVSPAQTAPVSTVGSPAPSASSAWQAVVGRLRRTGAGWWAGGEGRCISGAWPPEYQGPCLGLASS